MTLVCQRSLNYLDLHMTCTVIVACSEKGHRRTRSTMHATYLVAHEVAGRVNLEQLWPTFLINARQDGDHAQWPHVRMLHPHSSCSNGADTAGAKA